jgi:hypothetical protein
MNMKRLVMVSIMVFSVVFLTTERSIAADQAVENIKDKAPLSGKVVETMDSGRYTYVCLEKNDKKTWVAVYKMKIVVGQSMSFKPGVEMVNFESTTLKRKFDKIIFSTGPIDHEETKNEMKSE